MPYFEIRLKKEIPKDQNGDYIYDIFDDNHLDNNNTKVASSGSGWDHFIPIDY